MIFEREVIESPMLWKNKDHWLVLKSSNIFYVNIYVNMEPQIVILADISDLVDGVECSHNGGAPCSRDKEWLSAICQSLLDPRLQILWDHHTSGNPESDYYFDN